MRGTARQTAVSEEVCGTYNPMLCNTEAAVTETLDDAGL